MGIEKGGYINQLVISSSVAVIQINWDDKLFNCYYTYLK